MNLSQINGVSINIHKLFIFKASWLNLHRAYIWKVLNIIFFHPDGLTQLIFNGCSPWTKRPWSFHLPGYVRALVLGKTHRVNWQISSRRQGKSVLERNWWVWIRIKWNWFMGLEKVMLILSTSPFRKKFIDGVGRQLSGLHIWYQPLVSIISSWPLLGKDKYFLSTHTHTLRPGSLTQPDYV